MQTFYYLQLDNNIIINLTIGPPDWMPEGDGWIRWKNTEDFKEKIERPRIGNILDSSLDFCYSPQPYPSWTLVNGKWTPPVEFPADLQNYMWDEPQQIWKIKTQ